MLVFNVLNGLNSPPKFLFKYISCYCSTVELNTGLYEVEVFKYILCYCSTDAEGRFIPADKKFKYIIC